MTTFIPLTVNEHCDFDLDAEQAGDNLQGLSLETIQINIGLTCNLACRHCHVESSPKKTEQMTWQTMQHVLKAAELSGAKTIDITGGAPEMNPHFRDFVDQALSMGLKVMVRTNLTIILHEGYEDLPEWYAQRKVHLVASLPCYLKVNVDKQRGHHVYEDSIEVVQKLNEAGYGHEEGLMLDLVFNPGGPSLPPDQKSLKKAYRFELKDRFNIDFNELYTITNVPIGRFLHDLQREGKAETYMSLLKDAFNPGTLEGLMCRHQLHVSYDGNVHDCDFNYALGMTVEAGAGTHISEFSTSRFLKRRIQTADHCYACTAGCGSSCGGALV